MSSNITRRTLLALAGIGLAGCNQEAVGVDGEINTAQGPSAGGGGADNALSTTELDKLAAPTPRIKVGVIVPTREDPFYSKIAESAEAEAAEHDGLTTTVAPFTPALTVEKQVEAIRDLTSKKMAALIVVPVNSSAISQALKDARAAGVLVVTVDQQVPSAQDSSIYVDDEMGGRLAGEEMLDALNALGSVAFLEGNAANPRHKLRAKGFEEGIQSSLDIVVRKATDGTENGAALAMRAILDAKPALSGVLCVDEVTAIGALKSIRGAGLQQKVKLVCMGYRPVVHSWVESTGIHAAIDFHPELLGKYAMKTAMGMASNHLQKGRSLRLTLEVRRAAKG